MTFGQQIQALRREKGLSQHALASMLYVTRQSISQWENDKAMPSVDLLLKLSQIFGVSVDKLLGKPETESIPQPAAEAEILCDRRKIRKAMNAEFSVTITVLLAAAIGFGIITLLIYLNYVSAVPQIILSKSSYVKWEDFYYALASGGVCLAAAAILFVIRIINVFEAVGFAKKHKSRLKFFYDHMTIEEENTEPFTLFYSNVKRVIETDYYFVFMMQNRVRLCVDKRGLGASAEQLSMYLKSAGKYLNRRIYKDTACAVGEKRLFLIRLLREAVFVLTFFMYPVLMQQYYLLLTGFFKAQSVKIAFWLVPFIFTAAAVFYGIFLTAKRIRAKRLIIAGSVTLILIGAVSVGLNSFTLYDFQSERITTEQFTRCMEERGLEVENTIKGRQETFISACLTANPENKTYKILYMEFDRYSGTYGLMSAYETFGKLYAQTIAKPRQKTRYTNVDLWYNKIYTEETENHYTYISLNEYSVIYFETVPEKKAEIQAVLSDLELGFPY